MNFLEEIQRIRKMVRSEEKDRIASNHYFLSDESVLAYPRGDGVTRQPYVYDGRMLWAYSCGYLRELDGAFNIFPEVKEGDEPSIAFFANVGGEVISLLGMPIMEEPAVKTRYTVFAERAAYYFVELENIAFVIRVFLAATKDTIISLAVLPGENAPKEITISSYFNPYLRNDNSSHTLWYRYFKEGKVEDENTVSFYVTEGNRRDCNVVHLGIRQAAIEGAKITYREQTTARAQFVGGINNTLNNARVAHDCKIKNPIHCKAFDDYSIAGDVTTVALNGAARFEYRFGTTHERVDLSGAYSDALYGEINYPIKSNLHFEVEKISGAPFSAKVLSEFLRKVQYQVNICALGKDLYGGGDVGFRDVCQQVEQSLVWNAEDSRAKLLFVLEHMFPNGRAPRSFTIPTEGVLCKMDLSNYIDMGIWMINAMDYYLRYTGDFAILDEVVGYYEIVDEDAKIIKYSDLRDSVLSHLIRIADRLVRNIVPETGCVRMLYADWNDSIDTLGKPLNPSKRFGDGVSVMATMQAYENFAVLIRLLKKVGGLDTKIEEYENARETIRKGFFKNAVQQKDGERRILHGWGDKRSYFVGSFHDLDGKSRVSVTSVAFFALSGLYDPSYQKDIVKACERLDGKYGLRTFDEPFGEDSYSIGRIGKLPAGTGENAATYIHGALFGVHALFSIGLDELGTKQILKLLPISYAWVDKTPYVMQNSYCYNPRIYVDGAAANDWFTGSGALVMKIFITDLFGIQPQDDELIFAPAEKSFLENFKVEFVVHGKTVRFFAEKTGKKTFAVNGKAQEESRISYADLQEANEIKMTW